MMPWPGLLEPFTECLGLGVIGALCAYYLLGVNILLFLPLHAIVWFCCDLLLIKTIEVYMVYLCVAIHQSSLQHT